MDRIRIAGKEIPVLIKYKNIRHTYLRIRPDRTLYVTTSYKTKEESIVDFIRKHEMIISNNLDNLNRSLIPLVGSTISLFGINYPIKINPFLKKTYLFEDNVFSFRKDENKNIYIKKFYQKIVIEKAYILLQKWMNIIGKEIDFNDIILKSQWMKSQFGSCQHKTKIIKLNSVLACFDERYLDTILVHELIHLKIQNHGKDFYKMLLSYIPNYHQIRHELGIKFKSIEG